MTEQKPSSAQSKSFKFRDLGNTQDDGWLTREYGFKKFETYKFKAATKEGSKIEYKATLKDLNSSLDDDLKATFKVGRFWEFLRIRRNGDVKLHVDGGNVTLGGREFNVFGNLKSKTDFKSFALRLGANYFGKNCTSSTRFEDQAGKLGFTNRTRVQRGDWFGLFVTQLVVDGLFLNKYDGVIGYTQPKYQVYLQHNVPCCGTAKSCKATCNCQTSCGGTSGTKCCTYGLGNLTGKVIYNQDKLTLGAQVEYKLNKEGNRDVNVVVGGQKVVNDKLTVQSRISNDLNLELSSTYKFNNQITIKTAGQLALSKGASAVDFSKFTPIPLGFEVAINI